MRAEPGAQLPQEATRRDDQRMKMFIGHRKEVRPQKFELNDMKFAFESNRSQSFVFG